MKLVKMRLTTQRIDLLWNILVVLLVVDHSLFVRYTNASHQLRSFVDDGKEKRELQLQSLPPPNDDCTGALIIPSNFLGDTYRTSNVSIVNATKSAGPPPQFCYVPPGIDKDVWYQYKPSATSFYGFSTSVGDAHMVIFAQYERATTCKQSYQLYCTVARPTIDVKLDANVTYLLKVYPALANVTGSMQLVVERRRPSSNNLCTNSTNIDPTVETFLTVDDNAYALHDKKGDFPIYSACNTYESPLYPRPTFWYKFVNPLSTPLSVDISVDVPPTDVATSIGIVRGANCNTLRCIGGKSTPYNGGTTTYDFIAAPNTPYYILLKVPTPAPFNVTIKGRPQFFMVIDSVTDKAIQLLKGNIDYYQIGSHSINLNLRARLSMPSESIKSVRLTYDNPKRNVCDHSAPYTVFGDSKGDYYNKPIQLGRHRVTATPYTQPNCTGKAGTTLTQDFTVTGCPTIFQFELDSKGRDVYVRPFTSTLASQDGYSHTRLPINLSLQCKINLKSYSACSFPVQSVWTELRNANTGTLIRASNSSYFIRNGRLPAGSYSLRAIIDNVKHPTLNFTVINTTCD